MHDEEKEWSAGDDAVDYGSCGSIGSDDWDCRSQELYDDERPDYPLSQYHLKSKPRLLQLQTANLKCLDIECMLIKDDSKNKELKEV